MSVKTKFEVLLALVAMVWAGCLVSSSAWAAEVGSLDELKTCLGANGDSVCTLTDDIELDGRIVIRKEVELNLGGHNITSNASSDLFAVYGGRVNVTGAGTIGSSTSASPFGVFGSNDSSANNFSVLNVGSDVSLMANDYAIWTNLASSSNSHSYGVVVNFAGKINARNAFYINGTVQDIADNAPIYNIVDGAVINTTGHVVYAAGYGKWTFGAATMSGGGGIGLKAGSFVFNNTNVSATGAYAEPVAYNNGINDSGATFQIESNDAYADHVNITINGGTYTSSNGHVVYEYKSSSGTMNAVGGFTITGGEFNAGDGKAVFQVSDNFTLRGFITGGAFSTEPAAAYLKSGYDTYTDGTKYYVVPSTDFNVNFDAESYAVMKGHAIDVHATVAPTRTDHTSVTYNVVHTDNTALDSSEGVTVGSTGTISVAADAPAGRYKLIATDEKGKTDEAVLLVGSVNVDESKSYYVTTNGDTSGIATFAELGVEIDGEGVEPRLSDDRNASVDLSAKTVSVNSDVDIDWLYGGAKIGTTKIRTIYAGNRYIGKGGVRYAYALPDGLHYVVEDDDVVSLATETFQSGEYTYTNEIFKGLKAGDTKVAITCDGDDMAVIGGEFNIHVIDVRTNLKRVQAIGTSQTFTFEAEGYELQVSGGSSSMPESEDGEMPDVAFVDNGDGTYILTANRMPCYEMSDGGQVCEAKTSIYVYTNGSDVTDLGTSSYEVMLYEFSAEDQASEEVDGVEATERSNERTLSSYTAEILETIFTDDSLAESDTLVTLTLSDGSKATIDDAAGLREAVENGEEIKMILIAPEEMAEVPVDEERDLRRALAGVSGEVDGAKFVNIEVLLTAGGETYGRITDLDEPLTVVVDVEDDGEVAEGYTREYHVFRYHNGSTENMNARYNKDKKIVAFESDGFSTYLIAYVDTAEVEENNNANTGTTDDGANSETLTPASLSATTRNATPNTGANTVENAGSASVNVTVAAVVAVAIMGLAGAAVFAKRR